MAELSLEVSRREDGGKNVARRYRASGKVPAVVYGGHRDPVARTDVDPPKKDDVLRHLRDFTRRRSVCRASTARRA